MLAGEPPDEAGSRDTYVRLGAGEYRAGRSLDALLAAYRVGARLAWRRFVDAGTRAGFPPDALYDLGEAIFAYIDEISAESAAGFAEAQSEAAGEIAAPPPRAAAAARAGAARRRGGGADRGAVGRLGAAAAGRGGRGAARPRSPRRPTSSTRSPRGSRAGSGRARSARSSAGSRS